MFPQPYTGQILQRYVLPTQRKAHQPLLDEFVHELAHAFEQPVLFEPAAFEIYPAEMILDYIRRTHRLYLFRKLPEMEQSIHLLLQDYTDDHPLLCILLGFYSTYKQDLSLHILEEEQKLLPYCDFLLDTEQNGMDLYAFFKQTKSYSLSTFESEHHDDTEKNLHEIRETILLHEPPSTNQSPYRILVQQLQNFERDLTIHGLIEDHVLLPAMRIKEEMLFSAFREKIRKN